MKSVLFYCQYVLGIGHLTRSLALCDSLADSFHVDFLQGGPDVGLSLSRRNFRRRQLAPLLMRQDAPLLYDPEGRRSVDEVFTLRHQAIAELLRKRRYAHVIVELFPFGRRRFSHEIKWLIDGARRRNPRVRVHCSLRDILVEEWPERDRETVGRLRQYFDHVLVHSDPRFIRLEETFPLTAEIAPMLVYTGFVAKDSGAGGPVRRSRRVLVSLGGGLVGGHLAQAAAAIAPRLPEFEFRVADGPNTPAALRAGLKEKARRTPNLRLLGFVKDFHRELRGAQLSVSLAGYNTIMDLLRTRTPGLVLPYAANREQTMRARLFEREGLLGAIQEPDLRPAPFVSLLRRAMKRPYPDVPVDLSGAEKTRDFLLKTGARS